MSADAKPTPREERLHEAILAYFRAADAGRAPSPQEFLAAHPDLADDLQAFLTGEERLRPLLAPLRALSPTVPMTESATGNADTAPARHQYSTFSGPAPPLPLGSTSSYRPSWPGSEGAPAIPGYEILGVLGEGGMGVVYKARQVHMDRIVALKMIRSRHLTNDAAHARFRVEAQVVAKFDHPNIVRVYDSGEYGGQSYMVLEYVDGGSLTDTLMNGPWVPRRAAELVAVLADAVEYAHGQGVIHRDLKPANVLVTAAGIPKVADFGLAKLLEGGAGVSPSTAILGSPGYMPPEQAEGGKPVGPAADVYGLGGILYHLLTGRSPRQGESVAAVLEQARRGEVVSPRKVNPRVPASLERICLKALAADPAQRYASAAALAADLRRYVARPRRLALAAGAVAALLLLGVAAWLIVAATRGTSPGVAGTPTPSTESSAPLPLTGWVDVRVWDGAKARNERVLTAGAASTLGMFVEPRGLRPLGGLTPLLAMRLERPNPARRGLYLHQLDALPLKVLDQIQVELELRRPMFVYVVWINSAGKALPVYPWRNFEWDQRPAEEQSVEGLKKLPEGAAEDGWEMDEGTPGMETLLLLVRDSKLSAAGETALKAALAEIGPQPLQDGKTDAAVWFENGAVVTAEKGRAPKFDVKRIDDPVLRTQGVLRDKLGPPHFEYTRAVSFAFRGK